MARALALAEKLDTLVGFFAIDEKPTGSKDPYALRRAALGVIRIVLEGGLRLSLREVFAKAQALLAVKREGTTDDLLAFFIDRLKVALRDRGLRHDLVEAAVEGDDDLGRIVARVEALSSFLATEDGTNLLAGYKRAGNILKAEEKKGALPSGAPVEMAGAPAQETALVAAISLAEPEVARALQHEDFAGAMRALSGMRTSVDAFFEGVLVNSEVAAERENRLRLLAQVRDAMGKVADFSLVNG